ncbi:hypothetical protein HPB47_025314 [Ixodes persulcatus]|uniref:Uncharacterized protein n=1 Tax=Ixodes persulcatus TaxID=34615 RepID=A0AC60Q280_IXOPE|nr:hypothetical protein HPB47_025314 [Ixodes persulcatus]
MQRGGKRFPSGHPAVRDARNCGAGLNQVGTAGSRPAVSSIHPAPRQRGPRDHAMGDGQNGPITTSGRASTTTAHPTPSSGTKKKRQRANRSSTLTRSMQQSVVVMGAGREAQEMRKPNSVPALS